MAALDMIIIKKTSLLQLMKRKLKQCGLYLIYICQVWEDEERVEKVSDYLQVGQEVTVKVVEIDRQGRIRLTMKDLAPKQETEAESVPAEETSVEQE